MSTSWLTSSEKLLAAAERAVGPSIEVAKKVVERFRAHKKAHPGTVPFEQLSAFQQRMQREGEIQESALLHEKKK